MNRSSSKIRHIQKSNLILESRYLNEGDLTLQQTLQGKQMNLFKREDDVNGVSFSHTMKNEFNPNQYYKNIYISFYQTGKKNKNVGIEIICENPAYVEMCKQILESLNKYEDMEPILVDDNSDGKTKNTFGYEIRKVISLENLNDAFNSIKYIVSPITQIDGDDFVSNPEWVK